MPKDIILCPSLGGENHLRAGFFLRRPLTALESATLSVREVATNQPRQQHDLTVYLQVQRPYITRFLGITERCFYLPKQIHSNKVHILTGDEARLMPSALEADGLVTNSPGLGLGIMGADCGILLFYEPIARVAGVAHAGWRGALKGIIEAVVTAMENLGAQRSLIRAVLGPTIQRQFYEVGDEFRDCFLQQTLNNDSFFSQWMDKLFFDLPAYIAAQLDKAGIGFFEDLKLNTYSDEERFFSYRRACHQNQMLRGQHIGALMILPPEEK